MKKAFTVLAGFVFGFCLWQVNAMADGPLEAPADKNIYSMNRKFVAFLDYKNKKTTVYKVNKNGKKEERARLWEMPGWFRNAALSDDGEHFVVLYEGANLLKLDYKQDEVMLTFYKHDAIINQVRLNQLLQNPGPSDLQKTVSHYKWCESFGFDQNGKYIVNTAEKRTFIFDVSTGQPTNNALFTPQANASSETNSSNDNSQSPKTHSCLGIFIVLAFSSLHFVSFALRL